MNAEKFKEYSTEDFILDEEFVEWVLHPDRESDLFWARFTLDYPGKKEQIREAAFIVKGLQPVEEEIPGDRLELILGKIISATKPSPRIKIGLLWKYAAAVLLLAGISSIWYYLGTGEDHFPVAHIDPAQEVHGRVILSDGSSVEFDTRETIIRQAEAGKILINRDTVVHTTRPAGRDAQMNQVIIPYGKRSEITLTDGTHIWLNSGSQISYHAGFTDGPREVYLSGEAFFDVVTDSNRPFHVITRDVKIRVTGTRFNVTAYSDERTTATVLESGKVSIGKNARIARTIDVTPGQKVVYNRDNDVFARAEADLQYINSWVYGYLVFKNEPTPGVFRRLERYYNRSIISGEGLDDITFSGKLDLQDDLDDVLENVAFASSLVIIREDQGYYIKQNAYEDD